jgi:peptidoglycan/LPS O-acetylase OafA/YrhL
MVKNKILPNLTALRGIAATSVVFYHLESSEHCIKLNETVKFFLNFGNNGGKLGVQFFFILSGFLITYLLIEETKNQGKVKIFKFYLRRIFRIWPLYYITLIVAIFVLPQIFSEIKIQNINISFYFLFLINLDFIYNLIPDYNLITSHWSICIEEQFYLFWPLIFLIRKYYIFVFFLIFIFSLIFLYSNENGIVQYFHTFSNIRFMAFGGIIAYIFSQKKNFVLILFSKLNILITTSIYLFSLLIILFQNKLTVDYHVSFIVIELITIFFFSFVILEQISNENSFFKFGKSKALNFLGEISYSIYLVHPFVIYFAVIFFPKFNIYNDLIFILLTLLFIIAMSYLAYFIIEKPFLKLKNKFNG